MTAGDPRRVAEAGVWRGDERLGSIVRTPRGAVFSYDDAFLARRPPGETGVALRLPYASRRFETSGVNLHPFFAGLLPEGLRLRAVARLVKTSEDDLLSLLIAAGGDTVGDVAVGPHDAAPSDATPEADVERTQEIVFADLFAESLARAARPGEGWSVAGVQPKVSAARAALLVRSKRGRGAWILKLGAAEFPRIVENEAFFLAAARDCGLAGPAFRVVSDAKGESGLLVERFDRLPSARGAPLVRVHQEDACQFLDRYPADKYRLSLREIADGLAEFCALPLVAVAALLRLQAFSYAVGNGDLHAKNVSVSRDARGEVTPTPAYDLISTLPYGDERMALAMEGRDKNLKRRDFVAFGERFGVRRAVTDAMLDKTSERLAPWTRRVGEIGFDAKRTAHLARSIAKRLDALRV